MKEVTPVTQSSIPAHSSDPVTQASPSPVGKKKGWLNVEWVTAIVSAVLLTAGLLLDHFVQPRWFSGLPRLFYYALAYLPVGMPVIQKGLRLAFRGEIFTEFFLMGIATLGAFYVGEFPEAVGVMLFYTVGELFQGAAVSRAKGSIKALLDVRPSSASALRNGEYKTVEAVTVGVGETIRVRPGERVPLDSILVSEAASFNTSALTGESKPRTIEKGEPVLAGMISEDNLVVLKVEKPFHDSSLARILNLVQNAQGRKAKTELFIRRFAKAYTPVVVFLAIAITVVPFLFVPEYVFEDWFYRALIFLVISCPCALVVAIPLGYFGGIGAASRNGILFKGSSYLDRMTRIGTVIFDKTGTLTKGVFRVQEVVSTGIPSEEWLPLVAALEGGSTHPIAKAIIAHVKRRDELKIAGVEEIRGHGLQGNVDGRSVLAGNTKLLRKHGIDFPSTDEESGDTVVYVAVDRKPAGYIRVADELKPDAGEAVARLKRRLIQTVMLSGDNSATARKVASSIGIEEYYGDLLPEDKVEKLDLIRKRSKDAVAFVGDGINDAPVIAISDVGIAMGALGSDAAIETADVVVQTDHPSKIDTAIDIGRATNRIVWQNIALALGVKVVVLALGALGMASMWEAVFADVGVALLAILNAVRIQRMTFV